MNGPASPEPRPGAAFRVRLKREVETWQRDGLIDAKLADALADRYRFDDLAEPSMDVLVRVLIWIGSIAIAAGIITFVAAHWGAIGPIERFGLVGGSTLGAYALGWLLFHRVARMTTAAHAAVTVGALGFGATIALGAQLANAEVSLATLYLAWGLGLLPLALILGSVPVSLIVLATLTLASCFQVDVAEHARFATTMVATGVDIWLVIRIGRAWFGDVARVAGALTVAAFLIAAAMNAGHDSDSQAALWLNLSALFAAGVIALTANVRWLRAAGTITLLAIPFWGAFWERAADIAAAPHLSGLVHAAARWDASLALAAALALGAFMFTQRHQWAANSAVLGAFGIALVPYLVQMPTLATVVIENAAFALPICIWLRTAVRFRDRLLFIAGAGLLAGLAATRFAEFDTGLIVKSLAFLLTGGCFIAAAAGFNRLMHRVPHVA
jgi:uncharacterized membrane protein